MFEPHQPSYLAKTPWPPSPQAVGDPSDLSGAFLSLLFRLVIEWSPAVFDSDWIHPPPSLHGDACCGLTALYFCCVHASQEGGRGGGHETGMARAAWTTGALSAVCLWKNAAGTPEQVTWICLEPWGRRSEVGRGPRGRVLALALLTSDGCHQGAGGAAAAEAPADQRFGETSSSF